MSATGEPDRLVRENEALRRRVAALAEEAEHLRISLHGVADALGFPQENPSPVLRFAADGTLLYANASSTALLDQWRCQIGGQPRHEMRRAITEAHATRVPGEVEASVGEIVYALRIVPIHGASYVNAYASDITARKQAADALRESERQLIEAQSVAHLGSWNWDAVRDQITGSRELYRLFDAAPEDITRFSQFVERLHPDDRERVQQDVAQALHLDRPYDTDYRVKLGNGTWRDIHARGRVFTDVDGKVVRMAGTCLDITERKQADGEIPQAQRRARTTGPGLHRPARRIEQGAGGLLLLRLP